MRAKFILLALILTQLKVFSIEKRKLEKVTIKDLEQNYYAIDSSAAAVVLHDEGSTTFNTVQNEGFRMNFERTRRIKILKKEGLNYGRFDIILYSRNQSSEDLTSISAVTYNIVDGKIEKSKLKREHKFIDKISDNYSKVSIALPDVKEGSIVEINYSIASDFFWNLNSWEFQSEIPVIYSYYYVDIPQYYNYKHTSYGYFPFIKETRTMPRTYNYQYTIENPGYPTERVNRKLESSDLIHEFEAVNVPALKDQPYLHCKDDYITKIIFELQSENYISVGGKYYDRSTNWESIYKRFVESEGIGEKLKSTDFLSEIADSLSKTGKTGIELAKLAFNYIKDKITWNEKTGLYAENSLKKVYKEKRGSSPEINLMLVGLLRTFGFDANPVLLSTLSNGALREEQVIMDKFNYLICGININNSMYYMDASSKNSQFDMLPYKCYNFKGLMLGATKGIFVDILPKNQLIKVTTGEFKLNAEGTLDGKISYKNKDFAAFLDAEKIKNSESTEKFLESYKSRNTLWQFDSLELNNEYTDSKTIEVKAKVKQEDNVTDMADIIYIDPFLLGKVTENEFEDHDRLFPINFVMPFNETVYYTIEIPEGYVVEEMPKPVRISLKDSDISFTLNFINQKNKIIVTSKHIMKNTFYLPEDYKLIRDFYDSIVQKMKEKVILKKIA